MRWLLDRQARVGRITHRELLRAQGVAGEAPAFRADSVADLVRAIAALRRRMESDEPPDPGRLRRFATQISAHVAAHQDRLIATIAQASPTSQARVASISLIGSVVPERFAEEWVRANVDLITSIDTRFFGEIERLVLTEIEAGTSPRALAKIVQSRYDVTKARARLIARDQTAKLRGQIVQYRQTQAGITHYEWSTVGDERVRETHAAHDGKLFAWASPPEDTGHPGQDFQCRCDAFPVFADDPRVSGWSPARGGQSWTGTP